jgi:uncharacterized protein
MIPSTVAWSDSDNRASPMTEPPHDPFAALNTALGYFVAILAVTMLIFAVLPPIHLP